MGFRWVTVTRAGAQPVPPAQDGFVLIEVLVSAVVLAIAASAVLTLLAATTRSAADQRRHVEAFAIAQEDQARLRVMRISSLNRLTQTRTVTLDNNKFSVESTGVFVNNTTGTASCTAGASSADYVRITSTVTWPNMGGHKPVTMRSVIAPSNGSLDPNHGTLTVAAVNAAQQPLAGVGLAGTGPGTFSGTTDSSGCANFADLPAGNYTLTPSAAGLVEKEGKAPAPFTVGVVASGTQTVALEYDRPGALQVQFKYRVGSTESFATSSANSIMVAHPNMKTARVVTTAGGVPQLTVDAKELFPATSPYGVYAGSCEANNPNPKSEPGNPGAAGVASVLVPAGATATPPGTIQLPALGLVVKNGSNPVVGAKVKVTGLTCSFERTYTTVTGGVLPDAGLPWGAYKVCAATTTGTIVHRTVNEVKVENLAAASAASIDLGSGTQSGGCP